MKQLLKSSLVRSTGIYTFANLLNAGIPFLLLPYLTNTLTPDDYGLVAMFLVLFNLFMPFVGFSGESAISKRFFTLGKDELKQYNYNVFLLQLISLGPILLVVALFGGMIGEISQFPKIWIYAVILQSFGTKFLEIYFSLLRLKDKPIEFGVLRVGKTIIEIGATFALISILDYSWEGRVSAQILGTIATSIIVFLLILKSRAFNFSLSKDKIVDALKFGGPLIPHIIGATLITYSDRLFITNMVNLEEMGIYSVGYQVGLIIGLFQNSFNQAWIPWLFGKLKAPTELLKKKIVRFIYAYYFGLLSFLIMLVLLTPLIFAYLIGEEFKDASVFVFWIGLGFAINGMYKMVVSFLFYSENTGLIGMSTLFTAIINVALNYVLIMQYGSIGAAYATALAFFVQFVVIWVVSNRKYPMPWFKFI